MDDVGEAAVEFCMESGAEFADIRLEAISGVNIVVMDGKTKTVTTRIESGCGIRAFIKGGWGFSVCNSLDRRKVLEASEKAVRLAKVSRERAKVEFEMIAAPAIRTKSRYPCRTAPSSVPMEEKLTFALDLDKSMRSHDSRISSRNTRYEDYEGDRVVANSFGSLVSTKEFWTIASCAAWGRSDGIVQRGHHSVGNVGGYELMRTDEASVVGDVGGVEVIGVPHRQDEGVGKIPVDDGVGVRTFAWTHAGAILSPARSDGKSRGRYSSSRMAPFSVTGDSSIAGQTERHRAGSRGTGSPLSASLPCQYPMWRCPASSTTAFFMGACHQKRPPGSSI